jgi:hypothetical protein
MITDANLRVSSAQALGTTAATVQATDVVDLLKQNDIGQGRDVYLHVTPVGTAMAGGTITIQVIGGTGVSGGGAINAGTTVLGSSPAIAAASFTAPVAVTINPQLRSLGFRYLSVQYVLAGTITTQPTVTADFVLDLQDGQKYHASGFSVT